MSATLTDTARSNSDTLQGWVGRQEVAEDEAAAVLVQRVAALLDRDPAAFRTGAAVPEGWHVAFFTPLAAQSQLGPDGHPKRGDFLPPVALPRRMFAGRRLRFLSPIRIGAVLRRTSTIAAITPKRGRSGEMVFVRLEHVIAADGTPAVVEEQDIVYREEASAAQRPAAAPAAAEVTEELPEPNDRECFVPDATTLFRYSAITFNAHRIHYDTPYTQGEEGYPNLVVNGGLTALKLCELAKRNLPGGRLGRISLRNVRPFFLGRKAELRSRWEPDGRVSLWSVDERGRVLTQGEAAAEPGSPE
ncbi:FAS1-like dehydratase domain-containing protein [Rhodoplanes azumiensis]|uniref:MaoC family dehydratase N-terminal domain-containing protein n=1 Tax=Rhodoplanes azumiensis TaxID=1897628 RepID=A0ABW5AIZ9_9BRAD